MAARTRRATKEPQNESNRWVDIRVRLGSRWFGRLSLRASVETLPVATFAISSQIYLEYPTSSGCSCQPLSADFADFPDVIVLYETSGGRVRVKVKELKLQDALFWSHTPLRKGCLVDHSEHVRLQVSGPAGVDRALCLPFCSSFVGHTCGWRQYQGQLSSFSEIFGQGHYPIVAVKAVMTFGLPLVKWNQ